jgi:hypothetical protein
VCVCICSHVREGFHNVIHGFLLPGLVPAPPAEHILVQLQCAVAQRAVEQVVDLRLQQLVLACHTLDALRGENALSTNHTRGETLTALSTVDLPVEHHRAAARVGARKFTSISRGRGRVAHEDLHGEFLVFGQGF